MRVLVIEDDRKTAQHLDRGLSEAGYVVDRIGDGATGCAMAGEGIYDIVILDEMLPEMNGTDVVRALRRRSVDVPILMLSALTTAASKVEGLRAGADDYLGKPFAFAELTARIEAIVRRRSSIAKTGCLEAGDLGLDTRQRVAFRQGRRIELQQREFLLLETLMRHSGQVVTRSMLLEAAWPYDFEPRGNIVDMHIHRLRRKIDEGFGEPIIQTVVGAGYSLKPTVSGEDPQT